MVLCLVLVKMTEIRFWRKCSASLLAWASPLGVRGESPPDAVLQVEEGLAVADYVEVFNALGDQEIPDDFEVGYGIGQVFPKGFCC